MSPFYLSLFSALIVSAVSLVGIIFFLARISLGRLTLLLVSFAVGGLLGDAFIHLLPESFNSLDSNLASLLIISGLGLFFILEKILQWRHCHEPDSHHRRSHVPALNLVGDSLHNLIDGMLISASFLINPHLGLTTTLAVILHEIPQEIGDYGVLIHHGFTHLQAIRFNFISALFSLLGVVLTFTLKSRISDFSLYLLPITAGGFIYLASSDLIPELHRHDPRILDSLKQILFMALGVLLMYGLTLLE